MPNEQDVVKTSKLQKKDDALHLYKSFSPADQPGDKIYHLLNFSAGY